MKETKPYSRLVQQEQKKTVRQSIFLLILSIGILIAFLLFGLPLFFSVFLKLFGGGLSSSENQFPPQVPVLAAPVTATNVTTLYSYYDEPPRVTASKEQCVLPNVLQVKDSTSNKL